MIDHLKYIYANQLASFVCLLLIRNICIAQNNDQIKPSSKLKNAEIQYLSQWPSAESKQKDKKENHQIINLILGKKTQKLIRPVSIIATNQTSFWILDQQSHSIFQVSDNLGKVPHFIDKKKNSFSSLVGICNFHNNELLFTDSRTNKIHLVDSDKKECTILNDSLKLDRPTGIAYSTINNEIWVIETGAHRIVILNEKGEVKKIIGSRGSGKGEFNFPTHIWIDKVGNAYITDAMNFRIQVLNKEGVVISIFGSNGDQAGYFSSPKGIATDSYGHIYVADALFHAVQVFDINGVFLYTFGSQGNDDGQFWMPSGIYIDVDDKIYVADSYNSRIQIFQLIPGR